MKLQSFGPEKLTFNNYNPPTPGTAFPDDLGTFAPMKPATATVPGCMHRPFRGSGSSSTYTTEALNYPAPGTGGFGINWWQSTCPPHPAALAAKASDTITTSNGKTFRIVDDARPWEDAVGNIVKVTFLSEVEEPIS